MKEKFESLKKVLRAAVLGSGIALITPPGPAEAQSYRMESISPDFGKIKKLPALAVEGSDLSRGTLISIVPGRYDKFGDKINLIGFKLMKEIVGISDPDSLIRDITTNLREKLRGLPQEEQLKFASALAVHIAEINKNYKSNDGRRFSEGDIRKMLETPFATFSTSNEGGLEAADLHLPLDIKVDVEISVLPVSREGYPDSSPDEAALYGRFYVRDLQRRIIKTPAENFATHIPLVSIPLRKR